jgi:hypothetical protein
VVVWEASKAHVRPEAKGETHHDPSPLLPLAVLCRALLLVPAGTPSAAEKADGVKTSRTFTVKKILSLSGRSRNWRSRRASRSRIGAMAARTPSSTST